MSYASGQGASGSDDRFGPISQLPYGAPLPQQPDPPGYFRGWPLANIAKRTAAGFLDWVVFWFLVLMSLGFIAAGVKAIAGQRAGEFVGLLFAIGAYVALFYNFGVLQSRTGQTWGKRVMGLRTVRMEDLRPPGKAWLSLRPFFEVFEIFTGIAFISAAFSRYRQTLVDKFCGIIVIDERRAGMTLPWTLPQDPVAHAERPQPQGGVPRPQRTRDTRRDERDDWYQPREDDRVERQATGTGWGLPEREVDDDYAAPPPWRPDPPKPAAPRSPHTTTTPKPQPIEEPPRRSEPTPRAKTDLPRLPPLGGYKRDPLPAPAPPREPAPPPAPAPASEPVPALPQGSGGGRFMGDRLILDAIAEKNWVKVNERCRAIIEKEFDQGLPVDIEGAVAEYRELIRYSGSNTKPPDVLIARWLGLSD